MSWVVTAKIRRGSSRIASKIFQNKSQAIAFADDTNRDRPGSNARVKKV